MANSINIPGSGSNREKQPVVKDHRAMRHQRAMMAQFSSTGKLFVPGLGLLVDKDRGKKNDPRRARLKRLEKHG